MHAIDDLHATVQVVRCGQPDWRAGPRRPAGRDGLDVCITLRRVTGRLHMSGDSTGGLVESEAPLDASLVAELHELDPDGTLFADLVTMFLRDTQKRLDLMHAAMTKGNADAVRRIAHGLRGGSASLAAARMATLCAVIEGAATSGDLDTVVRTFPTLQAELAPVEQALHAEFPTSTSPATPTPEPASRDEDRAVTSVLIVDDHQMFADSLSRLLAEEDDIAVVGIAHSGAQGVALSNRLKPQVALIDHQMPDQDGVLTASEIRRNDPATMVVMITASTDERVLLDAIEAGCSGYLTKDRAAADVVDAVRAAAAGESLISPAILARLLPKLRRSQQQVGSDLTERETAVLTLMAHGTTNKAIAEQLYVSVNTVRNYVQSILGKLHAHSKLEAVSTAVREGIVDYPARP